MSHVLGLSAIALLGLALAAPAAQWRISLYWWFRPAAVALGLALAAALLHFARLAVDFAAYAYLALIGALCIVHLILLAVTLARSDWRPYFGLSSRGLHPVLRKAIALERILNFPAAIAAYDEYLAECPADLTAKARLAEALIKSGNSRRAVSVLTIAFTEAEEPRQKIAFGIRLAEIILVAERQPLAARAQLEQLKTMFAGTAHERYVAKLSKRLMKRVAEGVYLKPKPPKRTG